MSPAVRVLAVDDQQIFLRTVADLIVATDGFEQVGEALSGPEALALVAALDPDLVLLDMRMPGMSGIETAQRIAEAGSTSIVVLVTLDAPPELELAGVTARVRKKDLCVDALHRLWDTYGPMRSSDPLT